MATFEPSVNSYYIIYTNDVKNTFSNYVCAGPMGGGLSTRTLEINVNAALINTYTSFAAFNNELSTLKVGTLTNDPFLISSYNSTVSTDDDGNEVSNY